MITTQQELDTDCQTIEEQIKQIIWKYLVVKKQNLIGGDETEIKLNACHECYGTNIVLASQLYSSSSADTTEGTSDLKTLLEFYQ